MLADATVPKVLIRRPVNCFCMLTTSGHHGETFFVYIIYPHAYIDTLVAHVAVQLQAEESYQMI
jgi:hypothetical protein